MEDRGGGSGGEGWDGAVGGIVGAKGGILAINWLGSAVGRSRSTDCWAVQSVHVDLEP